MTSLREGEWAQLQQGALSLGVVLDRRQGERLLSLWTAVEKAAEKVNLTGIQERGEGLEKHLLDSIAVLAIRGCQGDGRLLDVGSGGGFPGLALKAACPQWEVVLLDATRRKVQALENVTRELGWEVGLLWGRAEEKARGDLREAFARVTARALASPWVALEWVLPFAAVGGEAWFWWGPSSTQAAVVEDLRDVAWTLGARLEEIKEYRLPFSGAERRLWVFKKEMATPDEYPRRVGVAQRKPLGRHPERRR
ncbi:MAG: 16S rRNA (guanine(527)-N(7))-methyltransferase RsmG [Bacillota bacterium]|nr:16S rRNA (guanine(527)-N(7))-methyltransferase RsmG [Bacillota bacterium]